MKLIEKVVILGLIQFAPSGNLFAQSFTEFVKERVSAEQIISPLSQYELGQLSSEDDALRDISSASGAQLKKYIRGQLRKEFKATALGYLYEVVDSLISDPGEINSDAPNILSRNSVKLALNVSHEPAVGVNVGQHLGVRYEPKNEELRAQVSFSF